MMISRSSALPWRQATTVSKTISPAFLRPTTISQTRLLQTTQSRLVAFQPSSSPGKTKSTTPADAYAILAAQRRQRPTSPHLSIYRPQLTWYLSGLNRITGSVLSGAFYVFGAAYLVSPLLGWHLDSQHLADAFGNLGSITKSLIKFTIALPFAFHSYNGIRHLVWDSGRKFANQSVIRSGWLVVGLTVVSSGVLAYM